MKTAEDIFDEAKLICQRLRNKKYTDQEAVTLCKTIIFCLQGKL